MDGVAEQAIARATRLAETAALGVGLGYRAPHRSDLFRHRDDVDFLEITADHFFDVAPEKRDELDLLAANFSLIPHGLDLSLGSADGIDLKYLAKFKRLIDRVRPEWWSEHIAFTRAGGVRIGHLAALPFTREALDALCRNVREVCARIDRPLILENITYVVRTRGAEMTEAQFLTELCERTGCGLLLDITNLYTNAVNHDFDPVEMLRSLPLERIVQLHFVGGHWDGPVLIDSHSMPTPEAVWKLLEEVLRLAPVKGVILERDENIPPLEQLLPELRRAREMGRLCGRWS
jgi:hypothetical protein